ncbi:MAG TPA: histidine phosphatase family protein [Rubrivivax sp.]|nr:histidine phosphatase family protein [Rubrivivax sp.]
MDLILWRHADAGEPLDDYALDLQRSLSAKGEKQAARMADWLNRFLPESTRVLASPALRCRQTAQALGRKFQTREALGPGGGVDALLTLARWPERREPVLVVGHQPTLGMTAALLMAGAQGAAEADGRTAEHATPAWSMRKGAVWWLRHRERHGVAEVVLVSVRSPDSL